MKHLPTTLFLSLCSLFLYCQVKNETFGDKYFFSEFNISINRTSFYDSNTQQRLGFGAGACRIWNEKKKINPVLGFECNITRLFIKEFYENYLSNLIKKTQQYSIRCASFPLSLRCVFGKKAKFFIESGLYFEVGKLIVTGTSYSYTAYLQQNQILITDYKVNPFREKGGYANYGVLFGSGMRMPAKKNEFVIKMNYKFGLSPFFSHYNTILNWYIQLSVGYKIW